MLQASTGALVEVVLVHMAPWGDLHVGLTTVEPEPQLHGLQVQGPGGVLPASLLSAKSVVHSASCHMQGDTGVRCQYSLVHIEAVPWW